VKRLVACGEASRLDAATGEIVPPMLLMEDASLKLWEALEPTARSRGAGEASILLAICGSGNNGGDALALIRHARFSGLTRVAAVMAKEPGELAAIHLASLKALGVDILSWADDRLGCEHLLAEAGLIVDGLSGTGLSGPLREPLSSLLEAANEAVRSGKAAIASIDLPSGLSDSYEEGWPLAAASRTLSIEPRKACLYYPAVRESCGEIVPIEGVFPAAAAAAAAASAFLLGPEDLRSLAPLPPDSAYKGSRGKVAVFAGSRGASGAAVLASRACLAAGAGIVTLFASRELYPIAASMLDAVMVKAEPDDFRSLDASRYDAVLVGPGWGVDAKRLSELEALLELGLPMVIDADAIHLYRDIAASGRRHSAPIMLTPHPGEFAALTGIESSRALASPSGPLAVAAKALDAVIVYKSHVTWIASPSGEEAVWDGRESGLGTAGSGDVLAGLAAGLLARSVAATAVSPVANATMVATARAAVIAHGLAGRRAREARGWFESGAIVEEAAKILGMRIPIYP
jgi:ADP-dependent NAD(P)H-hydrate dehydratase / NAD(P)H-hydrate epimerase